MPQEKNWGVGESQIRVSEMLEGDRMVWYDLTYIHTSALSNNFNFLLFNKGQVT